jgi:hypothetical protein
MLSPKVKNFPIFKTSENPEIKNQDDSEVFLKNVSDKRQLSIN